jgi:hypothetical protein
VAESAKDESVVKPGARGRLDGQAYWPIDGASRQIAIDAGEPVLADLGASAPQNVEIPSGAQALRHQLGCAKPKTLHQIVPRYDEITPVKRLPSDDDVCVWVAGIEVVDGDPIEAPVEIGFDPGHQGACILLQIVEGRTVFRRNNQPKLSLIIGAPFPKGGAVGRVIGTVVKLTSLALSADSVALDVFQVGVERAGLACLGASDMHFNNNTAQLDRRDASMAQMRHARCGRPCCESFAGERPLSPWPQMSRGCASDLARHANDIGSAIANATKSRGEVVVSVHCGARFDGASKGN